MGISFSTLGCLIICRHPLLLSDDEAEALLELVLTGPQAKATRAKQRPLSGEDASDYSAGTLVGLVLFQHLMMGVHCGADRANFFVL